MGIKDGKALTTDTYFKNMLVPVDGSRFSLQAEEVAADLAKKFGSKVTVLYVVSHELMHPPMEYQQVPASLRQEIEGMFVQRAKQTLGEAKMLFDEEGVQIDALLEEFADPPDTILEVAREKKSDLLVLGNRGASRIADFSLGGVAEKVSRHAECPVLIVKKRTPISKILVAFDGSKHAQRALDNAVQLAQKYSAAVTLLHVAQTALPHVGTDTAKSMGERVVSEAAKQVKEMKVDQRVEVGNAAKTIINIAKKENFNLIALGSRGLSPARRFLMGSVSDKVARHAPCSVLIIK